MAQEFWAIKREGGFQVVGAAHKEAFEKLTNGKTYRLKVTEERTKGFHRKVLALFRTAFEYWEPDQSNMPKGVMVERDFDHFRKKLTIRAGFYVYKWNPDGTFDLDAKSIAWDKMEEDEFQELFSALIDAILQSDDIVPKNEINASHFREVIVSFL